MTRKDRRIKKRIIIRKAAPPILTLLATALLLIAVEPVFKSSDALAQGSENRREAKEAAAEKLEEAKRQARLSAARETAKRKALESAQRASLLSPDCDRPFDSNMVNYLRQEYNIVAVNVIGKNLCQVVGTRGNHSLREDGKDCVSCHGDPALVPGADVLVGIRGRVLCNRLPRFQNANKPRNLKFFFSTWRGRNC